MGRGLGSLLLPRLRGTAALQGQERLWSFGHGIWRASGPSAPRWTIGALLGRDEGWVFIGFTAARDRSPPRSGTATKLWSRSLEGVRSLGAVLDDWGFVGSG